ncbi:MAG: OadG family protein [Desulfobacterales bacterium]
MIFEGLKLSLVGMLVVFSFLILLVMIMHLSTALLRSLTEKEEREAMIKQRKKSSALRTVIGNDKLMAIISAAVAAHRARMQKEGVRLK